VSDTALLQPILTPTPRWPDMMCLYDPQSRLLFSSKLFSAHASPSMVSAAVSHSLLGPWGLPGPWGLLRPWGLIWGLLGPWGLIWGLLGPWGLIWGLAGPA